MGMIYNGDKNEIKQEIRRAAKRHGMTMREIADKLGIVPQGLNSRFLRDNLSLDEMRRICDIIGCSIDIYIVDNNEPPSL